MWKLWKHKQASTISNGLLEEKIKERKKIHKEIIEKEEVNPLTEQHVKFKNVYKIDDFDVLIL